MSILDRIRQRISEWISPEDQPAAAHKPVAVEKRPLIGISGAGGDSKSVAAIVAQIRATGGEPVFLGDHAGRLADKGKGRPLAERAALAAKQDLAKLDGLIVMGNNDDIDPAKYGAVKDAHTKVETNLERAAYEESAIRTALDAKIPLMGICGGMQRINVMDGGTIHQHIPDLLGSEYHNQSVKDVPPFVPVQAVHIKKGTALAAMGDDIKSVYVPQPGGQVDAGVVLENSFHHQAVDKVGQNFRVAAVSDEDRLPGGIVQAIEPAKDGRYNGQFVLGVQWHPEFGASNLGPKIATEFTKAAKTYSLDKNHSLEAFTTPEDMGSLPLAASAPRAVLGNMTQMLATRQIAAQGGIVR